MRRLALIAVAACFAAFPAPSSANAQQAGIQVALRALGLYLGPIDGIFGPQSVTAIRTAQARAHLPVTGIVDARTRASLGPLGTPLLGKRVVRAGDFGLDVAVLQYMLTKRGYYDGALDGYMGKQTMRALRRYQRHRSLVADGVVGPRTLAAFTQPVRRRVVVATTRVSLVAAPAGVRDRLDAWAAKLGVSRSLVRALAWMESGYQPNVVSPAGARGVLQTLPSTREYVQDVLAGRAIPNTVDGDIEVGILYLRHLLAAFDGDERLALAAWYQGEGAVRKAGVLPVTKPFVANVLALRARM